MRIHLLVWEQSLMAHCS